MRLGLDTMSEMFLSLDKSTVCSRLSVTLIVMGFASVRLINNLRKMHLLENSPEWTNMFYCFPLSGYLDPSIISVNYKFHTITIS